MSIFALAFIHRRFSEGEKKSPFMIIGAEGSLNKFRGVA
jgi:hypothetical protein